MILLFSDLLSERRITFDFDLINFMICSNIFHDGQIYLYNIYYYSNDKSFDKLEKVILIGF